jgi:hypothetical protein
VLFCSRVVGLFRAGSKAIEFFGNTVIFVLAGVVVGDIMYTRIGHIGWNDVWLLLLLYICSNVIRFVML